MIFLGTLWYTLLALLGLSIPRHAPLLEGAVGHSCRGVRVTDGVATCSNYGQGLVCNIICEDEYQGKFTCTGDEVWTPELPRCARPYGATDDALPPTVDTPPGDNGCPNDAMCMRSCKNRGYKSGRCHGNICNCR